MAGNKTFTMIKPDAYEAGNSGAIIKMIEEAGFKINAAKLTKLTAENAGAFYGATAERSIATMAFCSHFWHSSLGT